jgi:hypothetical protein
VVAISSSAAVASSSSRGVAMMNAHDRVFSVDCDQHERSPDTHQLRLLERCLGSTPTDYEAAVLNPSSYDGRTMRLGWR